MAKNQAFKAAEKKIAEALENGATELDLSCEWDTEDSEKLTELPESLTQLGQLQELYLEKNQLTALPESLGRLTQLQSLDLGSNQLAALPESLSQLTQLQSLDLSSNQLAVLPESLSQLTQLQSLDLGDNQLTALPEWLGQLKQLQSLDLHNNELRTLPESFAQLRCLSVLSISRNNFDSFPEIILTLKSLKELYALGNLISELPRGIVSLRQLERLILGGIFISPGILFTSTKNYGNLISSVPVEIIQLPLLKELSLDDNPLNPELAAAYKEGHDAVKRYLRAKAEAQVELNEAKLILIGEGEVGKSCLLGALRGDPWEEGKPTTHGIEIKPVKLTDSNSDTEIKLNGWDFGGQRVYRPTHQLFFSAPAIYLVVWKPREGAQQGFVKDWIKMVKHREPDAKILIVATHGGPRARQPDIDRQEIWDLFGRDTVIEFFSVNSKPNDVGNCDGMDELKRKIAEIAAKLPEMGRSFPKSWQAVRTALTKSKKAYLPLDQVFALCKQHQIEQQDASLLLRILHRVGDLIHYEHDTALRDIVVLKPDWLATAMSYVLDDKQTRDNHGLVEFSRLSEVWGDPARPAESRYESSLYPLFLRLMERFDLSYKVSIPAEPEDALGFWQRVASSTGVTKESQADWHYTSLIAQLVPDLKPEPEELAEEWPMAIPDGESQQAQICQIVETRNGQSANAEGLFYQLIVRLHKHSLGRVDYRKSLHWQRGLVLDNDYNGRALLEHIGNDVHITVRAAYPQAFLAMLTHEVKYLVENFWEGLRCDVMVPCIEPCGKNEVGTGLYKVQKLIESKKRKRPEYPCPICNEWQDIDSLLLNAPAAQPDPLTELLENFDLMKAELNAMRQQMRIQQGELMRRFNTNEARILSKISDAYTGLMQTLTDEAKEGPRLFSLQPVDPGFFDQPKWISQKFHLTLWCEHSRLPLPALSGENGKTGVYALNLSRKWFVQAAPALKVLIGTFSLVLPVAASASQLMLDEAVYQELEKELALGQKSLDSVLTGTEQATAWLGNSNAPDLEHGEGIRAQGAVLRQLHAWLKEQDPSFGGLIRVQNKHQKFLWVHPQFETEY